MGFWAVLSAVIVMQVNVADSINMCLYRFTGTALGAAIGITALLLFPQTPVLLGVGLFLAVAFCAYMTRHSTRYRMAAITVVIVMLAGSGEGNPIVFGLSRVMEIGLGVLCAFVVTVTIWPMRAGAALKSRLERQFVACADIFHTITEAFISLQQPLDPNLLSKLDKEIGENRLMLHKALKHERIFFDDNTALLAVQVGILERCLDQLHALLSIENTTQGEGFSIIMQNELRALAQTSTDVMRAMGAGQIPPLAPLQQALADTEGRLQQLRDEGVTKRFHLRKLLQVFSFINIIQAFGEDLQRGLQRMGSVT